MAPVARVVAAAATVGALLLSGAAAAPNGGKSMGDILKCGGGGWSSGAPGATQRRRRSSARRAARGIGAASARHWAATGKASVPQSLGEHVRRLSAPHRRNAAAGSIPSQLGARPIGLAGCSAAAAAGGVRACFRHRIAKAARRADGAQRHAPARHIDRHDTARGPHRSRGAASPHLRGAADSHHSLRMQVAEPRTTAAATPSALRWTPAAA